MTHDAMQQPPNEEVTRLREMIRILLVAAEYDEVKLTSLRKSRRDWAFAATVMFFAHVLIIIMELAQ